MKYEFINFTVMTSPYIFHTDDVDFLHDYPSWHEALEIIYVKDGAGIAYVDSEKFEIKPNDIIIANSGSIHNFVGNPFVKYHCLIADDRFCEQNGLDITKIRFCPKVNDEKICRTYDEFVNQIENESSKYGELGIRAYLLKLLYEIAENYTQSQSEFKEQNTEMINTVKSIMDYIGKNFPKKITVDEIIKKSGFSRAYFSREFKRITRKTIVDYINTVRCIHAAELIEKKKLKIGEAALMCGFESPAYFSKIYKKIMKKSPSDMLKKVQ